MIVSDATKFIRSLRTIRVYDGLGIDPDPEREQRERDPLLPLLAAIASAAPTASDELPGDQIEAAVAVALARVNEDELSRLSALALASQVLALDGQFARLTQLSEYFSRIAATLMAERPFLAATLDAFTNVLKNRPSLALSRLTDVLGLDGEMVAPTARRTPENVLDVYLANALRSWMVDRTQVRLHEVKNAAIEYGRGQLLELSELLLAYSSSAQLTNVLAVVTQAEQLFQRPAPMEYLERRGIPVLFPVQKQAIESGVLSEGSFLLSMPTSSGKTFLAELRIVAELDRNPGGRAIYLAPYRLLARQIERELRDGLRHAHRTVRDFGADFDLTLSEQLLRGEVPDVALMTPERLDALMRLADSARKGSEAAKAFLSSIVLIVFDEIHLVGRPSRGPRLELLVSRLRRRFPNAPILGLSGVIDGIDDLARWLNAPVSTGGRRPTGTIELLWRTDGRIIQRFEEKAFQVASLERSPSAIDSAADLALLYRSDMHPVLILENSRNNAETVVRKIFEKAPRHEDRWRADLSQASLTLLNDVAGEARATLGESHDLPELIRSGLAYHHAGLPGHLLRGIERLASARILRALGATTTVAEGAHLPFRVVIIPHLNFESPSRKLEKDLYLNILGRAGRAGVAVEGTVIALDSDSPTLRGYVIGYLWNDAQKVRIKGRLDSVRQNPANLNALKTLTDVQGQILAWLGDEGSYEEDQVSTIAKESLSWQTGDDSERRRIPPLLQNLLDDLREAGLAEAASPYRLTEVGRRARLAGLGPRSCLRLHQLIEGSVVRPELFASLVDSSELSQEAALALARLSFEAVEVLEASLWFRRSPAKSESDRVSVLRDLSEGKRDWPYGDELYEVDVRILASWIGGSSYEELASLAPVFARGLFSGEELGNRAADAAEHLGRLSYPAAWSWSAAVAMLGSDGESVPNWIRRGIEFGVPSESATQLVSLFGLSRTGAVLLSRATSPSWIFASSMIRELTESDFDRIGLTQTDTWTVLERRDLTRR